jgi:hypothetical protein
MPGTTAERIYAPSRTLPICALVNAKVERAVALNWSGRQLGTWCPADGT